MDQSKLVVERTNHIIGVLQGTIKTAGEKTSAGLLALGKLYEINHNYFEASKLYRSLRSDSLHGSEAGARLAIVQQKNGQHDEALRLAIELGRSEPELAFLSPTTHDLTSIHTVAGDALAALGQDNDAEAHYQRAATMHPTDVHAAAMLARLALKQGNVERAADLVRSVPESVQRYNDIVANVELARVDSLSLPVVKLNPGIRVFDGV